MDARLYILAGTFALLLLALAYLLISLAGSRSSGRPRSPQSPPSSTRIPDLPSSPSADTKKRVAEDIDLRQRSTSELHEVLSAPLRTGDWRPDIRRREPDAVVSDPPAENPEPLHHAVPETAGRVATFAPVENPVVEPVTPVVVPVEVKEQARGADLDESPPAVLSSDVETLDAPVLEQGRELLVEPCDELPAEPHGEPVIQWERVPAPEPAHEEPAPAPKPEPAPAPAPAPEPAPAPAPTPEPAPAPAHTRNPEPPARPRTAIDFEPIAPVEMWFGDARVGVKPGTKTYEQFQRYASELLEELEMARRAD